MGFKGIASFAAGGTIILLAFWFLMVQIPNFQSGTSIVFVFNIVLWNGLIIFMGFLLLGLGLQMIIKNGKDKASE